MVLRAAETRSPVIKQSIGEKIRNERFRWDWRVINRACGKTRAGTIKEVGVKHGEAYIRTNGRRETEQAIQRNLKHKLGNLTAETPMMKGNFAKSLGPVCENAEVRSTIISGKIRLDGEEEDMILMLHILS